MLGRLRGLPQIVRGQVVHRGLLIGRLWLHSGGSSSKNINKRAMSLMASCSCTHLQPHVILRPLLCRGRRMSLTFPQTSTKTMAASAPWLLLSHLDVSRVLVVSVKSYLTRVLSRTSASFGAIVPKAGSRPRCEWPDHGR